MHNRTELEGNISDHRGHYSEKGGHQARGNFWKDVDQLARAMGRMRLFSPDVTGVGRQTAFMIRRTMFRDPQDGRR